MRIIAHIDMDAFYAAVEERYHPELRGRPVVAFEEASIDEAYLDLSSLADFAKAEAHAKALKRKILDCEGLTSSVGIAPNKLVAKIASDFQKPDGLTIIRPEEVQTFLDLLRIRVIPGIGPKTEESLHEKGIRAITELRAVDLPHLTEWFGRWGEDLYRKARGMSESVVSNEWEAKSVGEQETFESDTLEASFILEQARRLAAEVFRRVLAEGFRAFRTVTVTVRFADFVTTSRSRTSRVPLTTHQALDAEALQLLLPFLDARENPKKKRVRLIGVRVEKLLRGDRLEEVQRALNWAEVKRADLYLTSDGSGPASRP